MSDETPEPVPPYVTNLRVQCECGGQLGHIASNSEDPVFQAVCPACGTRYRRTLPQLVSLAEAAGTTVVVLPRARPRG